MMTLKDLLFVLGVSLPTAWLAGLATGLCIEKNRQRKAGLALYRAGLNGRAMNQLSAVDARRGSWGVRP